MSVEEESRRAKHDKKDLSKKDENTASKEVSDDHGFSTSQEVFEKEISAFVYIINKICKTILKL